MKSLFSCRCGAGVGLKVSNEQVSPLNSGHLLPPATPPLPIVKVMQQQQPVLISLLFVGNTVIIIVFMSCVLLLWFVCLFRDLS